ncbi:MAG TPA: hypothetical protein VMB80_14000 [Candidatus Acidoferrum sp.]|nr:hypothetical protein [Candidatus Acidoferrum sp.]
MQLDEAQRQRVTAWVLQGAKLSEIQNRLAEEFGLKMTYMEVRFLVDDLKLTLKDPEPPKRAEAATPPPADPKAKPEAAAKPAGAGATPPPAAGKVSVSVDQLARPGAIVSGKVTFSDGQAAEWYLDQTGRLGVVTKQQGYKPSAADVQQFQAALQDELARMGF